MGDQKGARQTTSLSQRVHLLLRMMIDNGRIGDGEKVLEAQVAKAFGVSRSPARRALRTLLDEGMLQDVDGHGYAVVSEHDTGRRGQVAVLDAIPLDIPRQWERMYEEVEKEIAIRILFGSVRVNEQKLADHFGVSRSVTRDVLARMDGLGLIQKNRAGHWEAEQVTPRRVGHLYELRWILEPQALVEGYPRIPSVELEKARDNIWRALASSPIASGEFDRIETDLHGTLLSYCPNPEILHALRRTQSLFVPTRYLSDPFLGIPMELIEAAVREHLEIVQYLLDGKPDNAARKLVQHLKVAQDRWLERFEINSNRTQQPLPPFLSPA